jgi:hypothetical protein
MRQAIGNNRLRNIKAWRKGQRAEIKRPTTDVRGQKAGSVEKRTAAREEPFDPELPTEGLTAVGLSRIEYRITQRTQ